MRVCYGSTLQERQANNGLYSLIVIFYEYLPKSPLVADFSVQTEWGITTGGLRLPWIENIRRRHESIENEGACLERGYDRQVPHIRKSDAGTFQ
jgi:hypothetical protein